MKPQMNADCIIREGTADERRLCINSFLKLGLLIDFGAPRVEIERGVNGLWYLSALICVYRVSGANGRLQGMKPQMNADCIIREGTADERRLCINSFSEKVIGCAIC